MEKYGGNKMFKPLKLVDAQELLLTPLDDPGFIVEDLIPGGVTVIAGDEKSGKSWMMLLLATCIATGQDFLGHPVKQGAVLYLSLEDTYVRLQRRLFNLTNEVGYGRIMLSILIHFNLSAVMTRRSATPTITLTLRYLRNFAENISCQF